jgi:hypothetical protein
MIFLHAAGVLDDDERIRVEERLRAMGEEGELARTAAAAALAHLALVLEPVEPPVGARQSLLDSAVQERARVWRWRSRRRRSGPPRVLSSHPGAVGVALAASMLLALSVGIWFGRTLGGVQLSEREAELSRLEAEQALQGQAAERLAAQAAARELDLTGVATAAIDAERERTEALLRSTALLEASRAEAASLRAQLGGVAAAGKQRVRVLEDEVDRLEGEIAEVDAQLRDRAGESERRRAQLGVAAGELARTRSIIALLEREELAKLTLVAAMAETVAHADLLWELEDRLCYMRAWQLQPLEAGRRYALWVVDEAGAVGLIGTFAPDHAGEAILLSDLPRGEGRIADTFVTLEETPIATRPIGPKVMSMSLREDGRRTRRNPYDRRRKPGQRRG